MLWEKISEKILEKNWTVYKLGIKVKTLVYQGFWCACYVFDYA